MMRCLNEWTDVDKNDIKVITLLLGPRIWTFFFSEPQIIHVKFKETN